MCMHTLCAGKPEYDDRGNSVKRFERAFGPEKRYIRTSYYYYYHENQNSLSIQRN